MNKNKLKTYAQEARREFIQAITDKANFYGVRKNNISPSIIKGDYTIIEGRPFPKYIDTQRQQLEDQINRKGFNQVIEEAAYTWFNRFAALRYMEINGFLDHGYRVLSHPENSNMPELLEKAQFVDFKSLNKEEIMQLKIDGNKDEEIYQKLIIAECNELSFQMPFLFEKVEDYTELLLPDNLLHSDSIIRKLVNEIDEDDWKEIEIIGWMYQFYISEKKDEVIGSVVESEDIPAATQLFTPNWIVKYLVQNSLGAHWMRTYPNSTLKEKMEYYIEPAEQEPEVIEEIKKITPPSLNPEELTLLDPACGSGHILVEAYGLLKEIYLERGYRNRDIPELILKNNLYGLEIDERAAQLSGFALMMKAREDDRNIFTKKTEPNVICIQEISVEETEKIVINLTSIKSDIKDSIQELLELFEYGKTFGSLIRIPEELGKKLLEIEGTVLKLTKSGELFKQKDAQHVLPFIKQAKVMSNKCDAVVANPPYMGGKCMNKRLKEYSKIYYPETKSDLFSMFIERGIEISKEFSGYSAMITMPAWLFLSSFENLRSKIINTHSIDSLLHLGRGIFGIDWGSTAFVIQNRKITNNRSVFFRLHKRLFQHIYYEDIARIFLYAKANKEYKYDFDCYRDEHGVNIIKKESYESGDKIHFIANIDEFQNIPGMPIAYWVSEKVRHVFKNGKSIASVCKPRQGLATGCNDKFRKNWQEIDYTKIGFNGYNKNNKWFPYNSGGDYRKWYGNHYYVVNWENEGESIKNYVDSNGNQRSRPQNTEYYFQENISWSKISSGGLSMRYFPVGFIFDVAGCSIFGNKQEIIHFLGLFNSKLQIPLIASLSPTINYEVGQIARTPFFNIEESITEHINRIVQKNIQIAKNDWDSFETSWDFQEFPMLNSDLKQNSLKESYKSWEQQCNDNIAKMKELEEENNRLFIDAYGLDDELTPEVQEDQITLARADKNEDIKRLISYAIGCMMGRYSLDEPGLIYANSENKDFNQDKYKTFPADDDGIIPITDHEWFDDDAAYRIFKFIETAWNQETLEANLEFIAQSISQRSSETSREAIRRYLVNDFFKDHLKTYKKRPIYWLFTSGNEKAFQAIVYLHRYNESTLSRMRTEYVLPLQGKIKSHMENLEKDKDQASSTSEASKLGKELDKLRKQDEELKQFDEKLRHYANMKIKIDLDDGVKVNYEKFGDLLAEVKVVIGKKKK